MSPPRPRRSPRPRSRSDIRAPAHSPRQASRLHREPATSGALLAPKGPYISRSTHPMTAISSSRTLRAVSGSMPLFSRMPGGVSSPRRTQCPARRMWSWQSAFGQLPEHVVRALGESECSRPERLSHFRLRRACLNSFTNSSSVAPLAANSASSCWAAFFSASRSAVFLVGRAGM